MISVTDISSSGNSSDITKLLQTLIAHTLLLGVSQENPQMHFLYNTKSRDQTPFCVRFTTLIESKRQADTNKVI